VELISLILAILSLILVIAVAIFLWWQFNFTDSRLCKLIDNRSKPIETYDDYEDEESYKEENNSNGHL
jgi:hypothetical protein